MSIHINESGTIKDLNSIDFGNGLIINGIECVYREDNITGSTTWQSPEFTFSKDPSEYKYVVLSMLGCGIQNSPNSNIPCHTLSPLIFSAYSFFYNSNFIDRTKAYYYQYRGITFGGDNSGYIDIYASQTNPLTTYYFKANSFSATQKKEITVLGIY